MATVDEFITKISQLPKAEREELVRRLNAYKTGKLREKKGKRMLPKTVCPSNLCIGIQFG